jgi:hypothetical protein
MKHPVFTSILILLGLVFLAGGALTAWQGKVHFDKKKDLKEIVGKKTAILGSEFAPTKQNLAVANENYNQVKERENELFNALKGRHQFTGEKLEAADLVGKLRESSEKLNKDVLAAKARIYKPAAFGFGFRRYLAANDGLMPRIRLDDIALEKEIVEWLVGKLLEAKGGENNPLILQTVAREPVEVIPDRAFGSVKANSDEYIPAAAETLRKKDIANTYYFRFVFTSRTDVLRNFIRRVENSGYPLILRGITVSPAKKEVLEPPEELVAASASTPAAATDPAAASVPPPVPDVPVGFNSGTLPALPLPAPDASASAAPPAAPVAPAAAAPVAPPPVDAVVRDTPSEFTVAFEYVVPLPAADPAAKPLNN